MHKNIENESIHSAQTAGDRRETTAEVKADTSRLPVDDIPEALIQEPMEMNLDPARKIKDEEKYKQYYPLTHAQKRIYYDDIIHPGSPWANIGFIVRYKEELEFDLLEQAINISVLKNDGLRLRIVQFDYEPEPKQYISEYRKISISYIDLSGVDSERRVNEWCKKTTGKPFQLIDNDLFYFAYLKLNQNESGYFFNVHHTVADGWSCFLLFKEINDIYEALREGKTIDYIPNPSYINYIEDEKEYLESDQLKKDKEFWHNKLLPLPKAVDLSSKKGDTSNIKANNLPLTIPDHLRTMMNEYRVSYKASFYNLMLSALYIYISAFTGLDEFVIGGVNHGRSKDIYKKMVGMFVSTLLFKIKIDSNMTFHKLVDEIRTDTNNIIKNHQKYPFDCLATELREISKSDTHYLRNIMLIGHTDVGKKIFNYDYFFCGFEPSALLIRVNILNKDKDGLLELEWIYQVEHFSELDIRRFHHGLINVLSNALINPGKKISEIEIISKEEKEQILFDFNDTETIYPNDKTIHELFETYAEKTPDNSAVIFQDKLLTYEEFNKKVNQLARVLRERGVKPDQIAALLVERSLEMMIGIFAIQKAGGAYLPIEPNYPRQRIDYLLKDSGAKLILCMEKFLGIAKNLDFNGEAINLEQESLYQGAKKNPVMVNKPGDIAYIIYTSGSTGKPKGVMIEHFSVINRLNWMQKRYPIAPGDVVLQKTTYVFDVSVWELFCWSFWGASQYLLIPGGEKDPAVIIEAIEKNNISTMHFVPSMLNVFLGYIEGNNALNKCSSLKQVFASGEALTPTQVEKFNRLVYQRTGKAVLINLYGPTEATVDVSFFDCPFDSTPAIIPIGKPIDNTHLIVVNNRIGLQPVKIAGELCISGDPLARGYLNRPILTAEKFIANPYANQKKLGPKYGRLYRTGDLAHWLPDGNIEYLGRIDFQVKVRGFRIELGEIESQLLKIENIKEAVVLAKEDNKGEKYLCAYFVASAAVDISLTRKILLKSMPDYMVPSHFVQIDKIPLTPNGKLDRKALPELELKSTAQYAAPTNETEEILAGTWASVLGNEKIGIDDNFFEIGGDSIKAIRIASKLQKHKLKMEVNQVFLQKTIRQLAKYLKPLDEDKTGLPVQGVVEGKVELTPIQKWLFTEHFSHCHHFNQSVTLHRKAGFNETYIEKVFTKILEHHDALRMKFKYEDDPQAVVQENQGIKGKFFDLEVIPIDNEKNETQVIKRESCRIHSSIDLQNGSLVKLGLFKGAAGDHLLIVIHHLAVDGVCWRILLEDFETGYQQAARGEEIIFQEKTASYKSWSQNLKEYAQSKTLLKELPYWQEVEGIELKHLPVDQVIDREERKFKFQDMVAMMLPEEKTRQLLTKVNRAYNTGINDILLAALGLAIKQWAGMDKVGINLESHGREMIIENMDITRTVGWFTTQYPVILDTEKTDDLSFYIRSVKETLRAIPNKGIGYGILKYLTPMHQRESLGFKPAREILFNYLGKFEGESFKVIDRVTGITDLRVEAYCHPQMAMEAKIDIEGVIDGEKLKLLVIYNKKEYKRETLEKFADILGRNLETVIDHCRLKEETIYTPGDFGYKNLSLGDLDWISDYIKRKISPGMEIQSIYPLSPMQSGLYFHWLKDEGVNAYLNQMELLLEGEIDKSLLEESLNYLIDRYDVFRTIISYEGLEEPVQIVLKKRKAKLLDEDISHLSKDKQIRYIKELRKRDRDRGFDLTRDQLVRFFLVKTGKNQYRLTWSFHHIILDGWCLPIIREELSQTYQTLKKGEPVELAPVTPYIEYIKWLENRDKEEGLCYWEKYLEGYEELSGLPKLQSELKEEAYKNEEYHIIIEKEPWRGLENMAGKNQVTINTVVQTSWGVLLQKYNNRDDVVYGTIVSGRPAEIPGVERMVGLFINMIPLRIKSRGEKEFSQLLQEVQENSFTSRKYEYLAAAEIQARSTLKGDLLDHILIFENYPVLNTGTEPDRGYIEKGIEFYEQTHYNFNIFVIPGEHLHVIFIYNELVFARTLIENTARHFENVLEQVVKNPGIAVREIEVITGKEKSKILYDFNTTEVDYPREKTIHELFELQAGKTPGNAAVIYRDKYLTYRELNERSNQLARLFREKGVGPDGIVPIMMERSLEMMIGIFGILKAGAAYLPIEPGFPGKRVSYLLKDSQGKIMLTLGKFRNIIDFDGEIINLEKESLYDAKRENGNLDVINTPKDMAYIIYTSGSTGLPKGVIIEHFSVINRLNWMQKFYPIGSRDVILQKTTFVFDVSVWELLWWSFVGACQYLLIPGGEKDPAAIVEAVEKNNISTMHFVPSMLNIFLADIEGKDVLKKNTCLKQVFTSGEALTLHQMEKFNQLVNSRTNSVLINLYGPTEATVDVSYFNCPIDKKPARIPIGKPIDNTKLLVVDFKFCLQPIGVPGELCITGDQLARGYLNKPLLTDEKFITNPLAKGENWGSMYEKLYRTGDLARWLLDGNIEYLGRIDHQVKIRGFRIETGEIENHIIRQKDQNIKEAVVIAREDTVGEKYLCAYIDGDEKVDVSRLIGSISRSLPHYMLPSYFVQMDHIPLTPSGKVDRKKLPDPQIKVKGNSYAAPRNEIEDKLAEIWSQLLHIKKDIIGIDDDFFKLGGHSLKAAVMITMIHKHFSVKVKMHEISNMPTIRRIGDYIKEAKKEKYTSIGFAEEKEYYPQTSAQKRLYFIDQLENVNILYNLPIMDIFCKGIKKQNLEKAFQRLIKRHESLRTSFFALDGEAVQKIHNFETVISNFEIQYYEAAEDGLIYPNTLAPGETKSLIAFTDVPFDGFPEVVGHFIRPFDLGQAPLLRVGLIKILGNTQILMMDMHHIISDGTSIIILLKELWQFYDEEEIPPLNVQYKDYTGWLNHETQKQEIKKQESFWLNEFPGEIPVLNLPFDYPVPDQSTFDGNTLYFEIEKEQTQQLKKATREQETNLYIVLLSLYNVLLAKLSGQEDIIVGTVTAGRNHANLQDIIGMFVKTLAFRSYPSGEKSFTEFLREVKEKNIHALENQDYPFEQLVSQVNVNPGQVRTRHPLFTTVFGLQNQAERTDRYLLEVLMLDKSNPYRIKIKKSKFDMTLMVVETGDSLQFTLEYNVRLFKEKTIERFIRCYKKIVSAICSDINRKISQIEIIPGEDKAKLLYIFNDTEAEYPWNKTIHELFEDQAARTPDNIAVKGYSLDTGADLSLRYKELNARTNQLARVLRNKGLKPEEIAAVMMEPSVEMIIGMLGILKAGGSFLPIDHKIPKERIQYMLEESSVKLFLTCPGLMEGMDFKGEIIEMDNPGTYSGDDSSLELFNRPNHLAYVIFTSGSTGKPKGVLCEHRPLINLCYWYNHYFSITPTDRVAKYASLGFDASVWEIFPHLIIGSALYIVPEKIKLDITAINQYFEENRISISFLPTQLAEQFMNIENTSLRVLQAAGDKLNGFIKKNYQLYNCYGPTENTVCATSYLVTGLTGNISIGAPIANNQIYILDKNDHLLPIGVSGELCIGGDGVARGYLNRPGLTAEKFIRGLNSHSSLVIRSSKGFSKFTNDKCPMTSDRLYRTGDLACWLIDGNIEFLGRIDYQVKVRGFRIELGEIENQLLHIENIKEAVVMVREDTPGQKCLCAYFAADQTMDIPAIKETLSKTLPEYMIPSFFVQIEKMPLNPSGKIDIKALPAPGIKGTEYAAPTNETEKMLADTWSEVLGIEKVSIDDNFFEIGGDSIKTIMITGRLQKRQISVNVNEFFLKPTIRQLASHLIEKEPVIKKEVVSRDEEKIQKCINRDYEKYLEKVRKEKWPDLTVENDYRNILLTGATGYLGAYLLYELLDKTSAVLYLPVRGATQQEAEERMKKKLAFYFGKDFFNQHKTRMFVLQSDLRENRLGIDDAPYEKLCETVEAVVHSAANVRHYGAYEELYQDNVDVTERLLEFAIYKKKKDFHHISTLSVGFGDIPGKDYNVFTEYSHDEGQESNHLYIKSKFEAEKRVMIYRGKGLHASIYRAGNVTFHSQTGKFQENIVNNAFYAIMKGIIKVGYLSQNMKKVEFDMSFVNDAAKAIVMLITRKNIKNETYHVGNPNKLSMKRIETFLNGLGLEVNDWEDENAYLGQFAGSSEYERIIERVRLDSWMWEETPRTITVPKIDRTVLILKKLGFNWPKTTIQHIEKMISHCKEVGFL